MTVYGLHRSLWCHVDVPCAFECFMSCNSSPDMSMILPADVARLCQQWHLDAKVPRASKSSSVFADVMPVSQPGVLLALYYGLSFLCMLQLLLQWWLRDRLDRVNGLDI